MVRWHSSSAASRGAITRNDSWLNALVDQNDVMAVWHSNHEHDPNSFAAIENSARVLFKKVSTEPAAYFFRYISDAVAEEERRSKVQEGFARLEDQLVVAEVIVSLGRRLVALA